MVFQHKTQVLLWVQIPKLSEQINMKQWKAEKLLCVIKDPLQVAADVPRGNSEKGFDCGRGSWAEPRPPSVALTWLK